ncbi:hypothetical protein CDV31_010939 [Fusarium ambrosium]|uniref:Amino acid permease/ SLC12A domain-containing protein n=1 Tax=Fusarium ambrosium TaxID=131363 RepID=A0A428TK67_9HYPO|nr:hypothetical protein CDV31_010939 [Fusarium ambrosium]
MDNASNLSIPISDPGKKEMGDLEPQTSLRHGQQVTIRADAHSGPETVDLATGVELSVIHRKLNARQIQLTSIAGSIGAALFVVIGAGVRSGPLALLVAFVFWAFVIFCVAQCQIEIVTLYPVDGAFIRLAGLRLALGKVLLALGLILFTLVVMLGGNPLNDRFGFRYWKHPGPWAGDDASNRLISFLNALNVAGFCTVGPEYISMIAGEAKDQHRRFSVS